MITAARLKQLQQFGLKRIDKIDGNGNMANFPSSEFSASHSNKELKDFSFSVLENGHQLSQVSSTMRINSKKSVKEKPIDTVHVTSERIPVGHLTDLASEIMDQETGMCIKKIKFLKGVLRIVDESEIDDCDLESSSLLKDAELMNKVKRQISAHASSEFKRDIILFRKLNSSNTKSILEDDYFSTKIETVLNDKQLIAQLRRYCNMSLKEKFSGNNDHSSSFFHDNKEFLDEDEVECCDREYTEDVDFPVNKDPDAFNVKYKCSFECWVCLSKFANCLDVKKHIIEDHSQGLCACARWESKGQKQSQSQLLLFCPNQCNYVTSKLSHYSYHYMVTCRKPAEIFMGRSMVEVQRDFISNEYFQLRKQIASRTSPNKLKTQELLLDFSNDNGKDDIDSCMSPEGQNLTDNFSEEHGKDDQYQEKQAKSRPTNPNRLMAAKTDVNDLYECDLCCLVFSTNLLLENHKKNCFADKIHGNAVNKNIEVGEKSLICKECGKGFEDTAGLEMHMKEHSNVFSYNCNECNKTFNDEVNLNAHYNEHFEIKPFKCYECGKNYSLERELKCHMKIHKGERGFKCDECCLVFSTKRQQKSHIMGKHSKEKLFKCTKCSKSYKYNSSLLDHLKTHNEVTTFICKLCEKSFSQESYLQVHLRKHDNREKILNNNPDSIKYKVVHTKLKSLQCKHCNKTYLSYKSFKQHVKEHGEGQFKCNECDKNFHRKYEFEAHCRTHSGETPFNCNLCKERFKSRASLSRHLKHHGNEKPFLCNECGKSFHRSSSFHTHMKAHNGIKPYQCTICNHRSSEKSYLKAHMRTHTGEKPYQCKICGIFVKNATCHMRTHKSAGEKPLECKECGARFFLKHNLMCHMRTHTGEKPFQCSECGKRFRADGTLRIHIMRHRGEKPHKCPFCSKGFVDKSHLTSHIRVHTGEKPYKCDVCDMSFNQNVSCRMHMKKHTDEELRLKDSSC